MLSHPYKCAMTTLAALSLLVARIGIASPDWPRFRGENANGISAEKNINKDWNKRQPRLLWRVPMGDKGYAGPACAGSLVVIIDHDGSKDVVRALSLSTGKEVWEYGYEETNREIYGFAHSTPTIDSGCVYTISRQGLLHCINLKTGKLVWKCDTIATFSGQRPMWNVAACPLVDGKSVIVTPGGPDAAIAALDILTGKILWHGGGSGKPAYATPIIATLNGKRQYITMDAEGAVGYSTMNGEKLWSYPWPTRDGTNVATPIVVNNGVFITSSYQMGCALLDPDPQTKPRWKTDEMMAHFNTPVLYEGYLYGTGDPGYLMCLDPATGKAKWKQPGFEKGGVVAVDSVLLAMNGSNGEIVMVKLNPERYEELGRIHPLYGQSWSPPIVANGCLIIRNKDELACLSLK